MQMSLRAALWQTEKTIQPSLIALLPSKLNKLSARAKMPVREAEGPAAPTIFEIAKKPMRYV